MVCYGASWYWFASSTYYKKNKGGKMKQLETLKPILYRILATFTVSGLGVVGAGAITNIPLWKAVMMAGFGSVAQVIEGLARAYLNDGKLSVAEIEDVFHQAEDSLPDESK